MLLVVGLDGHGRQGLCKTRRFGIYFLVLLVVGIAQPKDSRLV